MNSFPFTSQDGDRKVKTSDFRELFKKYFTNGVFNGTFNVVQSTGMKVILKKGWCNIEGCFGWTDEDIELTIESVAQETTHNIVLRLDDNREVRTINAYVVKGNPNAIEPTRTETVYELVVARIKTNVTTTSIQQSMIEDTRLDTNLCGIVSTTVETIDTTTFYEQIQGDLQEFKDNEQASFDEWFETIKNQLGTDAAGNLQNQIDDINAKKTSLTDANNNPVVTAPMIPPMNLLINGDFQINQRGQNEYIETRYTNILTLDCWIMHSTEGDGQCKIEVLEKGIRVTYTKIMGLIQYIDAQCKEGDIYTAILNIDGNIISKTYSIVNDVMQTQDIGYNKSTMNVLYDTKNKRIQFSIYLKDNSTHDIEYIDLFEGNIPYPHQKEDYSIALMRCQFLIQVLRNLAIRMCLTLQGNFYFRYPLLQRMNDNATVIVLNQPSVITSTGQRLSIEGLGYSTIENTQLRMVFSSSSNEGKDVMLDGLSVLISCEPL